MRPRAWARIAASSGCSRPARARRSSNRPSSGGTRVGASSAVLRSSVNSAWPFHRPRKRPGMAGLDQRGAGGGREVQGAGLRRRAVQPAEQGAAAPDGDEAAGRVGQAGGEPVGIVAAVVHAVERAAGIGVGAAGDDGRHAGPVSHEGRGRANPCSCEGRLVPVLACARPGLCPSWLVSGPGGCAMRRAGGRRRTGASPTRSGPEGSSRNEFPLGSLFGLPPHPARQESGATDVGLLDDTLPDPPPAGPACSATPRRSPHPLRPTPTASWPASTARPASPT